jgi:hypothetical protein
MQQASSVVAVQSFGCGIESRLAHASLLDQELLYRKLKGAQTRTWLVTCWFAWDGRSVR